MKVKIMITMNLDAEEYPIPADGKVEEEMEEYIGETFHEIEGVEIRNIKVVTEER